MTRLSLSQGDPDLRAWVPLWRLLAGMILLICVQIDGSVSHANECLQPTLKRVRGPSRFEMEMRQKALGLMDETLPEWYVVAEHLLKTCPPQDCQVIGVGRSPTVLIAILEELHAGYAHTLPYSRSFIGTAPSLQEKYLALAAMIDRQLGQTRVGSAKRVVIVDSVVSGESLLVAGRIIRGKLRAAGSAAQFELFGLTDNEYAGELLRKGNAMEHEPFNYSRILAPPETTSQTLDFIAEYPQFIPGKTDIQTVEKKPEFEEVRKRIRDWLKSSGKIKAGDGN